MKLMECQKCGSIFFRKDNGSRICEYCGYHRMFFVAGCGESSDEDKKEVEVN